MDLILKHGAGQRLDFTVTIPRSPHFGQFPVALAATQTLLVLQADKGRGVSTHARTLAGTERSGKGPCYASRPYPQESGPTPRKTAIFLFPGQSVLKYLPSGRLLKIRIFFPTPSPKEIGAEDIPHPPPPAPAAQKLPIPSTAHLVTTGKDGRTGPCKLPGSCDRAWGDAATRFLK